jgi:hypothetical protein
MSLVSSQVIQLSLTPSHAWEVLTDVYGWHNWCPDLLVSQPDSILKEGELILVKKTKGPKFYLQVTKLQTQELFEFTWTSFGHSFEHSVSLTKNDSDTTVQSRITVRGIFSKVLTGIVRKRHLDFLQACAAALVSSQGKSLS